MRQTLKTFFIPHEENGYHPHILHTKRTAFYGLSFLFMKVIVVGTALLLPAQVFILPDVLAEQQSQIIAMTNSYREEGKLGALTTHPQLFASAQLKSDDMAELEYFSHTNPNKQGLSYFLSQSGYPFQKAGENLAVGFSGANQLFNAWVNSPTHNKNLIENDFEEIGVGLTGGMYQGQAVVYVTQHFGTQKTALVTNAVPEEEAAKEPAPVEPTPPEPKEEALAPVIEETPVTPTEEPLVAGVEEEREEITQEVPAPLTTTELPVEQQQPEIEEVTEQTVPSEEETTVAATEALNYNAEQSFVRWQDAGNKETYIYAEVVLTGEVTNAALHIFEHEILLSNGNTPGVYITEATLHTTPRELFSVVVNPSLQVTDAAGNTQVHPVRWETIAIVSPTPIEKYTQSKTVLSSVTSLFDISKNVYFIAALFFAFALLLKIVIQIRHQHYHVIAQSATLVVLLFSLWVV